MDTSISGTMRLQPKKHNEWITEDFDIFIKLWRMESHAVGDQQETLAEGREKK